MIGRIRTLSLKNLEFLSSDVMLSGYVVIGTVQTEECDLLKICFVKVFNVRNVEGTRKSELP